MTQAMASGLDRVVAADTAVSDIDGEAGILWYRGERADRLAASIDFESAVALLVGGARTEAAVAAVRDGRAHGRDLALRALAVVRSCPTGTPLDLLRTAVSSVAWPAGDVPDEGQAYALIAAMPYLAAAAARRAAALDEAIVPTQADDSVPTARLFLRLVHEREPEAAKVRALDAYLVLTAEHSLNASTFAARVAASTRTDLASAIVAAMATLKGPLHGGAPSGVADMLDGIGSSSEAVAWIEAELDAGRRIMGFGHRVYRTTDPRATALRRIARSLAGEDDMLALYLDVERAALSALARRHPERALCTNVEFYTAAVHRMVGIAPAASPAVFALARTAGWSAHVLEQARSGRLIRPLARYVGVHADAAAGDA